VVIESSAVDPKTSRLIFLNWVKRGNAPLTGGGE
jgi:hypothetical protein